MKTWFFLAAQGKTMLMPWKCSVRDLSHSTCDRCFFFFFKGTFLGAVLSLDTHHAAAAVYVCRAGGSGDEGESFVSSPSKT